MSKNFTFIKLAALLLTPVFISLVFLSSCQKESVNPETTQPSTNDPTRVELANAQNDLIAYVDPLFAIVYVDPTYLNEAFELLQVNQNNITTVRVPIQTPGGVPLGQKAMELVFMPTEEIGKTAAQADVLLLPDQVETFEKEGTRYRVFRNAKCGTVQAAFDGPCYDAGNNRSAKNSWYAVSHCERGDSYCVEAFSIIGVRNDYDHADCNGPVVKIEPYHGWACK